MVRAYYGGEGGGSGRQKRDLTPYSYESTILVRDIEKVASTEDIVTRMTIKDMFEL